MSFLDLLLDKGFNDLNEIRQKQFRGNLRFLGKELIDEFIKEAQEEERIILEPRIGLLKRNRVFDILKY